MNVQARSETLTHDWPTWVGDVVNGAYPLRRILHGSHHSAVFLTAATERGQPDAAIKLVSADSILTDVQLRHWRRAAALSHPRLLRLFDVGQCELRGRRFVFVVMEYADQTLAQVLPGRALTPEEVRELLPPALDALGFMHRKHLVHGQLKPANLLVVGDQLKLASDTVRPPGEPRATSTASSVYDPPETQHGRFTASGDVWSLAVTMVEALTQSLPWPDAKAGTTTVPAGMPGDLAQLSQRCLSHDPGSRPSVPEIVAIFRGAPVTAVAVAVAPAPVPVPAAVTVPPAARSSAAVPPPTREARPALVAAGLAGLAIVTWAGMHLYRGHRSEPAPTAATTAPEALSSPAATAAVPTATARPSSFEAGAATRSANPSRVVKAAATRKAGPTARPAPPASILPSGVVHAQIPSIPRSALSTIHGRIKVVVQVMVDASGTVFDTALENPGPSSYFARQAKAAAKEWRFAPSGAPDAQKWSLIFEFARSGPTASAAPRP